MEDMKDMKVRLSTLWIFVMFNILAADIIGFLNTGALQTIIEMKPASELLLVFSVLLELPIAMIVLSRVLPFLVNRYANIIAGVITIVFIIGGGSNILTYYFFAIIEVACLLLMIWYAARWTEHKA